MNKCEGKLILQILPYLVIWVEGQGQGDYNCLLSSPLTSLVGTLTSKGGYGFKTVDGEKGKAIRTENKQCSLLSSLGAGHVASTTSLGNSRSCSFVYSPSLRAWALEDSLIPGSQYSKEEGPHMITSRADGH